MEKNNDFLGAESGCMVTSFTEAAGMDCDHQACLGMPSLFHSLLLNVSFTT
jgi:hypothetical protein